MRRRERRLDGWVDWVGTVAGVGLSPVAPGTTASVLWAAVYLLLPQLPAAFWAAVALSLTFVGTIAAYEMERRHGEDPQRFVLDEVVGMQIALLGVPSDLTHVLVALVLFRLFDILKPPPIHQAEGLPGGLGVMADDLLAGAFARLVLWVFVMWGLG
jgi:phosphatidylglycerophosphatase A